MKKFFDLSAKLVVAHRGYSGKFPENTLLAFAKAIEYGAKALEIDLRISGDGVVVVHHDRFLDRTTTGTGDISTVSWDYIRQLDAGGWFDPEFEGRDDCKVPRLIDVFDEFGRHDVIFELDVKDPRVVEPAVNLVIENNLVERTFFVGEESDMNRVKSLCPDCITVRAGSGTLKEKIHSSRMYGHEIVSWSRSTLDAEICQAIHETGRLVRVSHISADSEVMVTRLVDMGVDLYLTDWVETTVQVLGEKQVKQKISPPDLRRSKRIITV